MLSEGTRVYIRPNARLMRTEEWKAAMRSTLGDKPQSWIPDYDDEKATVVALEGHMVHLDRDYVSYPDDEPLRFVTTVVTNIELVNAIDALAELVDPDKGRTLPGEGRCAIPW